PLSFAVPSDKALFDAAQKVFCIQTRSLRNHRIVPVFEHDFLQDDISGVFWLEAASDQPARAVGKTLNEHGSNLENPGTLRARPPLTLVFRNPGQPSCHRKS